MTLLSYRSKFILIASLFAIPLALFAGWLAFTFHAEAKQAKLSRDGLVYLQDASTLISNLEDLRDNSVINFALSNSVLSEQFKAIKERTKAQIIQMKEQPSLVKHHHFLDRLLENISSYKISSGNEAVRIHSVFDNANRLVEQAYLWRVKLSYQFVSLANANPSVISLLDMINGNYVYFTALGEARAFGTNYLQKGYIDGNGIQLLENNYQSLTRLINNAEVREVEQKKLFVEYSDIYDTDIKRHLSEVRTLIDDTFIQAMSLTSEPLEYYQTLSTYVAVFHQYNNDLFLLADRNLKQSYQESYRQLVIFYSGATVMLILLAYLYSGFFNYVKITINDLVRSAKRVAEGEYEEPITLGTRDELLQLAEAMDSMRQSIKIREDELTRIGQTDGLTKLNNRKYFDDALLFALSNTSRTGVSLALVMMDIDFFKNINDQHGHQVGDTCLQEIAKLFKAQFQRKTDVVARYGGEEFTAILYGLSHDEALQKTEILRGEIESCSIELPGDLSLTMTASFGLVSLTSPQNASDVELLSYADKLLYQAKHEGRNRVMAEHFLAASESIKPNNRQN